MQTATGVVEVHMAMSLRAFDVFHRAHLHRVQRLLALPRFKLQEADQKNVAQEVWANVLASWPETPPDSERAYLTTMVVNAARNFYRRFNRKNEDQRRNTPLEDEGPSGAIDCRLVARTNVADEVERIRLCERFEAIACALPAEDSAIFRVMMRDVDDVPKKDRDRVLAKVREMMRLPKRPRSIEYPDDVEGPSHCGRTVRRLEQEQRAAAVNDDDWNETTEELDAAECSPLTFELFASTRIETAIDAIRAVAGGGHDDVGRDAEREPGAAVPREARDARTVHER